MYLSNQRMKPEYSDPADFVTVQMTAQSDTIGIVLQRPMTYSEASYTAKQSGVYCKLWSLRTHRLLTVDPSDERPIRIRRAL